MKTIIPKVIHYCWFGRKPLPGLAKKCMDSWKRYCPDYEIREWNETNFDVNMISYTQQAYSSGKYAFVSDYARFYILEKYGGIYMDTDVELIHPIDDIVRLGPYIGCEEDGGKGIALNPGLGMASVANDTFLQNLLDVYKRMEFLCKDGSQNTTTIVRYTTDLFLCHGLKDVPGIQNIGDYSVYPREYFSPQHYLTGKQSISKHTRSIHHYAASWYTPYEKFANKMSHILGKRLTANIVRCKKMAKEWMGSANK